MLPQLKERPVRDNRFGAKCKVERLCNSGIWFVAFTRNGKDVFRVELDGLNSCQFNLEEKIIDLAGEHIEDFINAEEVSYNDWGLVRMIRNAVDVRKKYK